MLDELFSKTGRELGPSAIRELKKTLQGKEVISLAGGEPSLDVFPTDKLRSILAEFSGRLAPEALRYGATAAERELRAVAVQILEGRSISADERSVILCSGALRGLDLLGRVLLDPGDTVIVELPSFPGALSCFRNFGVNIEGVGIDENGLIIDELERVLSSLRRDKVKPKILYTMPTFQNPSGLTMSQSRRAQLAELSAREGFLILEDDPYSELRFAGEIGENQVKPIAAAGKGRVAYLSGFSEILAPCLRTAFMQGPQELIRKLELALQASDIPPGTLEQHLLLALHRAGVLGDTIRTARTIYKRKRDALLKALVEFMPEGAKWTKPGGGFFTWVELEKGLNTQRMFPAAVETGVAYVPGRHFNADGSGNNCLRLSYSERSENELRLGAAALATTVRFWDIRDSIPWAFGVCRRRG